jgi:hypothetical protein
MQRRGVKQGKKTAFSWTGDMMIDGKMGGKSCNSRLGWLKLVALGGS